MFLPSTLQQLPNITDLHQQLYVISYNEPSRGWERCSRSSSIFFYTTMPTSGGARVYYQGRPKYAEIFFSITENREIQNMLKNLKKMTT